jgi:hypothetical protein
VEVLVDPVLGEAVEPFDRLPEVGDEVRVEGEPAGDVRVPGEPVGDGVGERLESVTTSAGRSPMTGAADSRAG